MKAVFGIDKKLEIKETNKPKPNADQLLIKTVVAAANPSDWKHIELLGISGGIIGSEASGIVEEVGANVTGYKKGDIVGTFDHGNLDERGKFGEYILGNPDGTIKVSNINDKALPVGRNPSSSIDSFEALASIPVGLATIGLSFNYNLNIPKSGNDNDYVLIWGGATSTGIIGIQIAKLVYNIKVITTCSSKNADFIKSLGADAVFDYSDESVVDKIRDYAKGRIIYALDTAGSETSVQQTYDATIGSATKALDCLTGAKPKVDASRDIRLPRTILFVVFGEDISAFGYTYSDPEAAIKSYKQFWTEIVPTVIPKLKTNNLRVLEPGLQSGQETFDLFKANKVSAEKLVFRV